MLKSLIPANLKQIVARIVRRSYTVVTPEPVGKVRTEAKAEYEAGWGSVLKRARLLRRSGEGNLARVLLLLEQRSQTASVNPPLERFGFRFCGVRVQGPKNWSYEAPLFELLLQNEILNQIDPDTERIVELGSGYGKNLFRIWLNGGPRKATYYGFEYTRRGRECADLLASSESAIRFRSQPFDYHNVDLKSLAGSAKTFVFTSYSIEQVPEISRAVFDALVDITGVYKVMHIEPVGWQRQHIDRLDTEEQILLRDMERSTRDCRYNTNLLQMIHDLAASGRIVVDQEKFDFLAHRPDLPGSIIVWRPVRTGPSAAL